MDPASLEGLAAVLHRDLVRRQLLVALPDYPQRSAERATRLAGNYEAGLALLWELLREDAVDGSLLSSCWELATSDPAFAYLHNVPWSAAFGTGAALAIQRSWGLGESAPAASITTLINVSITLLDGLIDEAPQLFDRNRRVIEGLLFGGLDYREIASRSRAESDHPAVSLTLWALGAWINRVRGSPAWNSPGYRRDFSQAVRDAYEAEISWAAVQSIDGPVDPAECAERLNNKSANAIWLTAVGALSATGLADSARAEFRGEMHLLGHYFGWIDDVSDLLNDLQAGRWNQVEFALMESRDGWMSLDRRRLVDVVRAELANTRSVERVSELTALCRSRLRLEDGRNALGTGSIGELVGDATHGWLSWAA